MTETREKSTRYIAAFVVFAGLIAGAVYLRPFGRTTQRRPNIVYILIDTLRADHLGYNGYERETSPEIDALARESLVYPYAYSSSSWTAPSVASLMSGLYTSVHGMMPPNSRVKAAQKFSFRLSDEIDLISEVLKRAEYQTAGVSANPWISEQFGYAQGFDYFYSPGHLTAGEVNRKAFRVAEKLFDTNKPFFLYLHYFDPHDPYSAPEPFKRHFSGPIRDTRYGPEEQRLIARYDGEIRYVDSEIGALLRFLKERGLYDDTLIVLTADHGEQFKERGNIGHGYRLYNEESRVPLLIRLPGASRKERIETPVSLVDVMPTTLNLAGLSATQQIDGLSLLDGVDERRSRGVLIEVARRFNVKALVREQHKMVGEFDLGAGLYVDPAEVQSFELLEYLTDKNETSPLTEANEVAKARIEFIENFKELSKQHKRYRVDTLEMSPETLEQLKTLGYL